MKGISVRSEIKPLKKVLLHRPGRELLNMTPERLPELLFDDIPFLRAAQQEHDEFASCCAQAARRSSIWRTSWRSFLQCIRS